MFVRDRTGEERAAGLFFASAGQINYLIPKEVPSGLVTVTVTNSVGGVSLGTLRIGAVAPGLFAANSNGLGVAAAIALSRATMRVIKQNLFWAFIYNVIGIPVAAGVLYPAFGLLLSPILASAAMAFSSVSVVTNSLRLRGFQGGTR